MLLSKLGNAGKERRNGCADSLASYRQRAAKRKVFGHPIDSKGRVTRRKSMGLCFGTAMFPAVSGEQAQRSSFANVVLLDFLMLPDKVHSLSRDSEPHQNCTIRTAQK